MQIRHVSTNLRQGMRRNLSMHLAVVLTLFVSLTLAGVGIMLTKQADLTTDVIGDELQLTLFLCTEDDPVNPSCAGDVTDTQLADIEAAVNDNPEVKDYHVESKQVAFDKARELGVLGDEGFEGADAVVDVNDFQESVWITLNDPDEFQGILSQVESLDGVSSFRTAKELVGPVFTAIDVLTYAAWAAALVLILAAIMLVANTIRLAALARRKEIEIMRLVGASRIFIALPFLLEALVTAIIGVLLSGAAMAAFTQFALIDGLAAKSNALPWIGWPEYLESVAIVAVAGPVLTLLPTLLLTRKYLRV